MRIKYPKNHEQRIITKFLYLPKRLERKSNPDLVETRWLEKCEIEQFYALGYNFWVDRFWND